MSALEAEPDEKDAGTYTQIFPRASPVADLERSCRTK
jgi:hypothetical protein